MGNRRGLRRHPHGSPFGQGDMLFDVSVPDDGPITINTFGKEVAANLIEAAIEVVRRSR